MAYLTLRDGTELYYKDLGTGSRLCSVTGGRSRPMLLGRSNALSGGSRLPLHRARPPRPRPLGPTMGRQRHQYLRRRSGRARRAARFARCDRRRPLDRRRRGRALHRPPRHGARRQGGTHRIRAAAHAQDGGQSRRASNRSLRSDSRRRSTDRSQFFKDLSAPFYGANRPDSKVSQGLRDSFWLQGMLGGIKGLYDCVKAFSRPTSPKTSKRWTYRRSPSKATTIRSYRSPTPPQSR